MIEALGKWIVTICVAIFFATAVQMILPDNSLKKYCNFVLGLIVFVVMITPILKLFNSEVEIGNIIEESASFVFSDNDEQDYSKYREANINATLEKFKDNLEAECTKDLKRSFKEEYKATFQVSYDKNNSLFNIDSVEITINDGTVDAVKEVQIGEPAVEVGNTKEEIGQKGNELRNTLVQNMTLMKAKYIFIKLQEKEQINSIKESGV